MEKNKNRVVLVTGSSRGIGLAIASAFAAQGDTIILNGRSDADKLVQSVEELRQINPDNAAVHDDIAKHVHAASDLLQRKHKVGGFLADLSDYAAAQDMFKYITSEYGPVDVLINNAGVAYYGLFSEMEITDIDKVLEQNLLTTINASRLAIPTMVQAKCGCIINISSIWGIAGASCEVIYSAAKAGIIGFTKALAKELGPSGVRVNAVACGAFDTRMNDNLSPDEKADFAESIPLGRFGHPEEVGALAVYIAGAEYMTGQVVTLDGGLL